MKRKRDINPMRQKKPREEEEDDETAEAAAPGNEDAEDDKDSRATNRSADSAFDPRHGEVLSDGGERICDFPVVIRRTISRPHASVVSVVVAERLQFSDVSSRGGAANLPFLENISHGQLQVLSAVLPDHPSLQPPDIDKSSSYVCTSPVLMEGKAIMKRFGNDQVFIVPMHSDWFSSTTAHRLERQMIPHFFNGKSADHTPEKYMALRNKIIAKYIESPGRRLLFADCRGLVEVSELNDLIRIVRFLDHWGIINCLSASSVHRGLRMSGSLLREDANGELSLQTTLLKSIDSLILFDRPKCSLKLDDIGFLPTFSTSIDSVSCFSDLDVRIRERLSEHACSYCSKPLPNLIYQSQKELKRVDLKLKQFAEVETLLLRDCEQMERMRQRISAERVRIMSACFSLQGASTLAGSLAASTEMAGSLAASTGNTNLRPTAMPVTSEQGNLALAYGNSLSHPYSSCNDSKCSPLDQGFLSLLSIHLHQGLLKIRYSILV